MAVIKVNSFDEFVTAVGTAGATVECPEKAEWNFNLEQIPKITINCSEIKGNGTIICNAKCIDDTLFVLPPLTKFGMYDLHFADVDLKSHFLDYPADTTVTRLTKTFGGCCFSGKSETVQYIFGHNTSIFDDGADIHFRLSPYTGKACMFDYKHQTGEGRGILFRNVKVVSARINFVGHSLGRCTLEGCIVQGKFNQDASSQVTFPDIITDNGNVFDFECKKYTGTINEKTIVNTDKFTAPVTKTITANTEQLKDAEYLESVGLKIGAYEPSVISPRLYQGTFDINSGVVTSKTSLRSSKSLFQNSKFRFDVEVDKPIVLKLASVWDRGVNYNPRYVGTETEWIIQNHEDCYLRQFHIFSDFPLYESYKVSSVTAYFSYKHTDNSEISVSDVTSIEMPIERDDGWRIDRNGLTSVFFQEIPHVSPENFNAVKQAPYIIIYDMRTEQAEFKSHGLCILHPTECIETETMNGAWEVSLTHPIDSTGIWQYIVESNILKVDGQLFIIRKIEQSFRGGVGTVKAWAEHIFYIMNEAWLFPNYEWYGTVQQVINKMIDYNNERYSLQDVKYFFEGKSDIIETIPKHIEENGETPVEVLMGESGVIAKSGGFLYRDNFYFSINKKMEGSLEDSFDIRVGKNLTGIKRVVDMSNFVTYFLGFLPDKESLFGVSWVWNKGNQQFFRTIKKSKIFNYDSLELTYEDQFKLLEADVMAYFNAYCKPLLSYEFDIQDLSQNTEYSEFTNLSRYKVGDMGKVFDERLGVSLNLPITKTRKNHITNRTEKVWIGNAQRTFTRPSAYNIDISELGNVRESAITGNLKDYEYNDIYDAFGNEILIRVEE